MVGTRKDTSGPKRKGRSARGEKFGHDRESSELQNAPHSFVFHRGNVGLCIKALVQDFRKIMEPFTASSLKVRKKNRTRDFAAVGGIFHVTHHLLFTRTKLGVYLRVARYPHGPTLSFKVHNYTLAHDIASVTKKHYTFPQQFDFPPLVVLNGFSIPEKQFELMTTMFQNMFPAINLFKVDLNTVKRCLLFNYDAETKLIDVRHYGIKVVPTGVSKGVKKLFKNKVPDLSRYNDIADFVKNPTLLSESEAEDDKANEVVLPQTLISRGNMASNVSAIRLVELGPRLTLQLLKAESRFLSGDVLFHDYITKTEAEIQKIKKRIQSRLDLKRKRRRIQEENVKKKQLKKTKKAGEDTNASKGEKKNEEKEEDEDDSEWFRTEVGEEPEADLFPAKREKSLKRKTNDQEEKEVKHKNGLSPTRKLKKKTSKAHFGIGPYKGKPFKKSPFKRGKSKK